MFISLGTSAKPTTANSPTGGRSVISMDDDAVLGATHLASLRAMFPDVSEEQLELVLTAADHRIEPAVEMLLDLARSDVRGAARDDPFPGAAPGDLDADVAAAATAAQLAEDEEIAAALQRQMDLEEQQWAYAQQRGGGHGGAGGSGHLYPGTPLPIGAHAPRSRAAHTTSTRRADPGSAPDDADAGLGQQVGDGISAIGSSISSAAASVWSWATAPAAADVVPEGQPREMQPMSSADEAIAARDAADDDVRTPAVVMRAGGADRASMRRRFARSADEMQND